MKKIINQIVKFVIIGGISFLIDYLILYILTEFYNIHYLLSSILSFTISVIFNYYFSTTWIFGTKQKQTIKGFLIFIFLSVIGLIMNAIMMYFMVEQLRIHYMISKLFSTIIVMIYNFITRKIFFEK